MEDSQQCDRKIYKQQDIYQRIELLGAGSFGKAFLVKEIKTGQLFVIKQINIADLNHQQQENARREAKILEILNHPNIIKFKEVYATSKMKLNIVMEYADGGDLAKKIQEAKSKKEYFEEAQILNWFTQICLGIKHLHERKILHRDLKGQNIFLTSDNCVKIGDLGVARVLQHTVAKVKTIVGSPYYLSPQIIQNRPYSFKSDIWSLGALLFEMCSLVPPFTANNLQFLALKIVKGSYSNIPPQYSNELRTLIRSMLNTNPNLRPTIFQILSSPIIQGRIKTLLSESQNIQEFSHTILHKYNPLKNQIEDKLRPPPNLIQIQQEQQYENLSAIVTNGSAKINIEPPEIKAKTPYSYGKNPPPIKKKPIINEKKFPIKQKTNTQDLAQIMQIKATPIEHHFISQKAPKVVSSPHVNIVRKRPESSKIIQQGQRAQKIPSKSNITMTAFNKKKSIDCTNLHNNQKEKNELKVEENKQEIENKEIQDKSANLSIIKNKIHEQKVDLKGEKRNSEGRAVPKKTQQKVSKITMNKPKTGNKNFVKNKEKKQTKLQLVSQQMKAKDKIDKEKKVIKKPTAKKPKSVAKKTKQQKQQVKQQDDKQIIQEQKCNDASDDKYDDQQFETYEENSNTKKEENSENESDLSFQLSNSSHPQYEKASPTKNENNYQKMLSELELIHKIVQQANGKVDNLPMMGQDIPQLLQMSSQVRQDDTDLQSELSKIHTEILKRTQSQLNLGCLSDQGELENLRIALQQIFGIQNIIKAYRYMQNIISIKGLDFNEEQTIRNLLKQCPTIDQCILRRYFRLIATVITLQNQLQQFN